MLILALSSLLPLCIVRSAHIVGIPSLGFSHGLVLAKVGRELCRRGHLFTLVVPSFQSDTLTRRAQGEIAAEKFTVKTFETEFQTTDLEFAMLAQMKGEVDTFNSIAKLWKGTCEALLKSSTDLFRILPRVDLVFSDVGNLCGPILADLLRIPRVDISPAGFMDPFLSLIHNTPSHVAYVPQMSYPTDQKPLSFLSRVRNTLLYILGWGIYKVLVLPPYEDLWRNCSKNSTFSRMEDLLVSTGLLLVPTDFAFDIPRPVGAHLKVIGPITPGPAGPLSTEFSRFITTCQGNKLVLVSFGTVISNHSLRFNTIIASAMAALPVRVLWKCSSCASISLPENVEVVPWMPQNDLLGQSGTSVFLTHGGLNSLFEAAYHGTPTIVIPLFGDQAGNAARVQEKKTGLVLDLQGLKPEHITSAVTEVLRNPIYKENALKVSRLLQHRQKSPSMQAADWVEYGLWTEGGLHLRSPSDDLYFFQLFLIDVIVFLLVLSASGLYASYLFVLYSIKLVYRQGQISKNKEES